MNILIKLVCAIGSIVGMIAAPLVAIGGLVLLIGGAATGSGLHDASPSRLAFADIPSALLATYVRAAEHCDSLPWQVLAAIGKVSSDHARATGAVVGADGRVVPTIVGPRLDGSSGKLVLDTDNGSFDGDDRYDRAVGPLQLTWTTWRTYAVDGNDDTFNDPNSIHDAAATVVRILCPEGTLGELPEALSSLELSAEHLDQVESWIRRYSAPQLERTIAGYALPLARAALWRQMLAQPHHDYPAIDLGVPVGTAVFAIATGLVIATTTDDGSNCGGTIIISGDDGAQYTYCHLSNVSVPGGSRVLAGTPIGASGGMPGMRGAGHTTGPHLHLEMRLKGRSICPQVLLLALYDGVRYSPDDALSSNCVQQPNEVHR